MQTKASKESKELSEQHGDTGSRSMAAGTGGVGVDDGVTIASDKRLKAQQRSIRDGLKLPFFLLHESRTLPCVAFFISKRPFLSAPYFSSLNPGAALNPIFYFETPVPITARCC